MIPFELKIFNIIYECGRWVTPVLAFVWFFYALLLMIRLDRRFWWWLAVLSLVVLPLGIGFTWCGFHYRMELYDRFARTPQGWHDIRVMPPEVRAEYAKHDYHPRARNLKAQPITCIVLLPVAYFFGMIGWFLTCAVRETFIKRGKDEQKENH